MKYYKIDEYETESETANLKLLHTPGLKEGIDQFS